MLPNKHFLKEQVLLASDPTKTTKEDEEVFFFLLLLHLLQPVLLSLLWKGEEEGIHTLVKEILPTFSR